mmetsp:Transcript_25113/g.45457  ORF Transcript_25113/g.45457 Transcript_25113/m.45457 type:complete len:252 (-) Transcript_25113:727-1482(-)
MGFPSLSFMTFFLSRLLDLLPLSLSFFLSFSSSSSLELGFLSCIASSKVILSCPGLASAAPMPSAVMPTMPSATTRRISLAGTNAHSSVGGTSAPSGDVVASAVKSVRCLLASPSPLAHSAMSLQSAAHRSRTSLSLEDTKLSIPRGSTLRILSRHIVAQADVRFCSSSSHMLPFFLAGAGSSGSGVQTRTLIFSRRSLQRPISGNCIITVCQLPRTQSLFLLASAMVARFRAVRNCARNRFGAQSYAVRS